jgi:hypothetical protein
MPVQPTANAPRTACERSELSSHESSCLHWALITATMQFQHRSQKAALTPRSSNTASCTNNRMMYTYIFTEPGMMASMILPCTQAHAQPDTRPFFIQMFVRSIHDTQKNKQGQSERRHLKHQTWVILGSAACRTLPTNYVQ